MAPLGWLMSTDQSFRNIYRAQESSWNVDPPSQNIRKYLFLCVSPEMIGTSYRYLGGFVSPDQSFRTIFRAQESSWNVDPRSLSIRSPERTELQILEIICVTGSIIQEHLLAQESPWNIDPPSWNIRKYLTLFGSPKMTGTCWFSFPSSSSSLLSTALSFCYKLI